MPTASAPTADDYYEWRRFAVGERVLFSDGGECQVEWPRALVILRGHGTLTRHVGTIVGLWSTYEPNKGHPSHPYNVEFDIPVPYVRGIGFSGTWAAAAELELFDE